MHTLAKDVKDDMISYEIRMLANELAILGNKIHESEIKENAPMA